MFPVVIPAAGYGTRSLPASKNIPKEMLNIYDRPTIQYVVEEAVASRCDEIIFVTSRGKSSIEDHFDFSPELEEVLKKGNKTEALKSIRELAEKLTIHSVRQKEMKGLGHAVWMTRKMISSDSFGVMLGDDLVEGNTPGLAQLIEKKSQIAKDAGVVLVMEVPDADTTKYGICELSSGHDGLVKRCIEKPKSSETSSRYGIIGRYLLPKQIFQILETQSVGASGEIQLTDALNHLASQGKLYVQVLKGQRFDAGDKIGYLRATLYYALQGPLKSDVKKLLKEMA